jgi:hypothetical protein
MRIRGIVQDAWIDENPPRSQTIEMLLRVRDVGPDGPDLLVVPSELLFADPGLEPRSIAGQGFEAEVETSADGRWLVRFVQFGEAQVRGDLTN